MKRGSMLIAGALTLSVLTSGCVPEGDSKADTLKIGAYSVVREAFHEGLIPAFTAAWKAKTGRRVRFEESYNASGAQARAIASGFDADLAVLSHAGDMEELVKAGRVKSDWNAGPNKGVITRSLVVIGHRPGNPKSIHDWNDLTRPDVGVLYPDPKTSGGARWNINAIYGAARLGAASADGGKARLDADGGLLARVQARVINMDPSGRQSMANFERGTGDAVVTYENELLLRRKEGVEIPYIVPPATLLIEGPAALVESSVERHGNREVAAAFLEFIRSPDGQRVLADYGFRPVDPGIRTDVGGPLPAKLFTIGDLGGWARVQEDVYGPKGLWTAIFSQQTRNR